MQFQEEELIKQSILVSVIIPNYNHARYLRQRIESILCQTYHNYEIIILDDKSMDDSQNIIEDYRTNPKVSHIVYNECNSGSTFKQWHKGIDLAQGEFIWIAESDDFCEDTLLERLMQKVLEYPEISLTYALSQMVDEDGNLWENKVKAHKDKFMSGSHFITHYMCCENPVYNASSAIFSKSVAKSIDGTYMDYSGAGDRLFWIEIAEKGNVAIVNEPLNYFRQHSNKVTPRKSKDGTNMREDFKTYQYIKNKGYLSSVVRGYLVRSYYLYLIASREYNSEELRKELYSTWGYSRKPSWLRRLVGRLFVSLRYHGLNLYL